MAREDRIHRNHDGNTGPWCDKAWHMASDKAPRKATVVLTCSFCGRQYARCAECNRGTSSARASMMGHIKAAHPATPRPWLLPKTDGDGEAEREREARMRSEEWIAEREDT